MACCSVDLVVQTALESVEEVMVGALLAVGVRDAVEVGEVAVQVHVVCILAPQQEVLAALKTNEIGGSVSMDTKNKAHCIGIAFL